MCDGDVMNMKEIVLKLYHEFEDEFYIDEFVEEVRRETNKPLLKTTITRVLSNFRKDMKINYMVKKRPKGLYYKLEIIEVGKKKYLDVTQEQINAIVGNASNECGIFSM